MEHSNIQAAVEAVLFASGEPVESEKLCEAVGIVKDHQYQKRSQQDVEWHG